MNAFLISVALLAAPTPSSAYDPAQLALHTLLSNYESACDSGGRRLWGRSLCTPVVVVDRESGEFVASQAAPGPLPATRANTAFDWLGTQWVMLLGPLSKDAAERDGILFHESFHAHQADLGLPSNNEIAGHLVGAEARASIRLEWRALAQALQSEGVAREAHVRKALEFRARRLKGNLVAAAAERASMRHEGLASYTGDALSGNPVQLALKDLEQGAEKPSLVRSFAYASGPAWGLLLDALRPDWKSHLGTGADLPDLMPAFKGKGAAFDYGEAQVLAEEQAREKHDAEELATAIAVTAEGKALRLPLSAMGMDFDPNRVGSTPDGSPLYWKIMLRDKWGTLTVDGSALRISKDFSAAFVRWPLPEDASLDLAEGWQVREADGKVEVVSH